MEQIYDCATTPSTKEHTELLQHIQWADQLE